MGSDLATTRATDLARQMPPEERHKLHRNLLADVEQLSDDDLAVLLALEQLGDYERVTRLPVARIDHHATKPGLDLGGTRTRELEAVVLLHSTRRGLWLKNESGAPTCASQDGIAPLQTVEITTTDVSTRQAPLVTGPQCAECEFNRWGSAGLLDLQDADSNSKACKEQRLLLLLVRGRDVPVLLFVPPTSLKSWDQHLADMAFAKRPLIGFYTKFSVEKTSSGGFDYGALRLELGDPVDAADVRRMFALRRAYEQGIQQVQADTAGTE